MRLTNVHKFQNPNRYTFSPNQQEILDFLAGLLSPEEQSKLIITSATRPKDKWGFHKSGNAIDLWCNTEQWRMIDLYERVMDAEWRGGVAVAGMGVVHHLHIDARHRVADTRFPHGWPACYFLEMLVGGQPQYPYKQYNEDAWRSLYNQIKQEYK